MTTKQRDGDPCASEEPGATGADHNPTAGEATIRKRVIGGRYGRQLCFQLFVRNGHPATSIQ
jgi:hypothetical protein